MKKRFENHLDGDTIQEYLDGALGREAAQEIRAHLALCTDCQVRLAETQALFAQIESLPEIELGIDLQTKVMDKISPKRINGGFSRLVIAEAVFALLLIATTGPMILDGFKSVYPQAFINQLTQYTLGLADYLKQSFSLSAAIVTNTYQFPTFFTNLPDQLEISPSLLLALVLSAGLLLLVGNGVLLRKSITDT